MPGDPGGVSLLFPPRGRPAPPLPRSGALYRARALGRLSSSSPRAAVGSARGGRAGHPGARRSALASLSSPPTLHSRAPSNQFKLLPPLPLFSPPSKLSVPPPPLGRYSSWLKPARAAPRAPPDLPACSSDHYRIQKHVDHTSVRLLRYRLLVQGTRRSREGGGRASRKPFEFSGLAFCPRLRGSSSRLDFLGSGKMPEFAVCARTLWTGRRSGEEGQERVAVAV